MMKRPSALPLWLGIATLPVACFGQATIEGTVQLPKTHFAPVENQRYEIVSKAGVLATDPPRAVVYLDGSFPRPANPPTPRSCSLRSRPSGCDSTDDPGPADRPQGGSLAQLPVTGARAPAATVTR